MARPSRAANCASVRPDRSRAARRRPLGSVLLGVNWMTWAIGPSRACAFLQVRRQIGGRVAFLALPRQPDALAHLNHLALEAPDRVLDPCTPIVRSRLDAFLGV